MGKRIKARFDMILPGEDGLDEERLRTIVELSELEKPLLPIPVREIDKEFLNLDGRNRLIYYYLRDGEKVKLFLSQYATDFMNRFDFPEIDHSEIMNNNKNINRRWLSAIEISQKMGVKNYHEHF